MWMFEVNFEHFHDFYLHTVIFDIDENCNRLSLLGELVRPVLDGFRCQSMV